MVGERMTTGGDQMPIPSHSKKAPRTCASCRRPNTGKSPFLCIDCAWREWGQFGSQARKSKSIA